MHTFPNYFEWHSAITGPCGLTLSRSYCQERIAALADPKNPSTRSFVETYGETYLEQVSAWFQQAKTEATE
ncbi:MAG: hypothetical protein N2A42_00545 [Luteolibacter sp.]|jgi:hypothetical protein|nr:hypothetical protein [Verrucomicrobiota bacterium]|tara:strand:+ start:13739 stop:13951 length:213 start_codon:yes stop_codon:yes gene_type:complete